MTAHPYADFLTLFFDQNNRAIQPAIAKIDSSSGVNVEKEMFPVKTRSTFEKSSLNGGARRDEDNLSRHRLSSRVPSGLDVGMFSPKSILSHSGSSLGEFELDPSP